MNGQELLRVIDTIHREKDIAKETLFQGIESAILTAARKKLGHDEEISINIDRATGDLTLYDQDQHVIPIDSQTLGRIAAQTAKQVIYQKIREAESDVIFSEFESREKTIVTGTVQRFEGNSIIVSLGKVEGILPKHEQVRGEMYHPGDRIRGFVYEVRKAGSKVRVRLSRTHPDFIERLFELEVPEIADRIIQIVRLVREPGYRTKIAVTSTDPKIDCVGACVGVRGTRIKNIIDELGGEKIDIIRWNDDQETLIVNALKPAQISSITLDPENNSALVIVDEDQLSLAIGKRGQNVRLASKLCQWDINIVTYKELEDLEKARAMAEEEGDDVESEPDTPETEPVATESEPDAPETEPVATESEDPPDATSEGDEEAAVAPVEPVSEMAEEESVEADPASPDPTVTEDPNVTRESSGGLDEKAETMREPDPAEAAAESEQGAGSHPVPDENARTRD